LFLHPNRWLHSGYLQPLSHSLSAHLLNKRIAFTRQQQCFLPSIATLLLTNVNAFCPQLQRFCSPMSMLFFSGVGTIGKQRVSNRKTRRTQRAKKGCKQEG